MTRDGISKRARIALAVGVLAVLCALAAWRSEGSAAGILGLSPDGSRSVSVRVYQDEKWTVPGETPQSVAATLAQLRPTYVEALVRFHKNQKVTDAQVAAWNTIREAVREVSPTALFSIELNAEQYPSAAKVEAMMSRVRQRFDNDVWLFDFYTPAARKKPGVMAAAVDSAHANGELIGGNAFGIAQSPTVPAGTDFLAVQDFKFTIKLGAVRRLAKQVPVFFHLGNSPGYVNSDGCVFIREYSTEKRVAYISRRAGQQTAYDFSFSYPVFFPECARGRQTQNPKIYTYNARRDERTFATIQQLMDRYDG